MVLACARPGLAAVPLVQPQQQARVPAMSSVRPRARAVRARSGDGEGEMETAFEKELRRRGLDSSSLDDISGSKSGAQTRQQQRVGPRPPPSFRREPDDDDVPPQLAKSRALNSEGLEGLIPRGTELLKLGVTFFLAFLPFILVAALAFGGIYGVFGDSFIHGGTPASGPPPYIDPDMLLAEPTADPMVPLDLR